MERHALVIDYDTDRYPFQRILAAQVFRVPSLDHLHLARRQEIRRTELTHADNLALRERMQQLPDDSGFYRVYHAWIAHVLAARYANKISYTAHPKMRVHLAGTGSVSEFHRDVDTTGRLDQINCYLPFTDVHDTCSIWAESSYDARDYEPIALRYGQALLWDGGLLEHGTFPNRTGLTRVSCDFRFSPLNPDIVTSPWRDVLAGRPIASLEGNQS
jgi:hypothetical protein